MSHLLCSVGGVTWPEAFVMAAIVGAIAYVVVAVVRELIHF